MMVARQCASEHNRPGWVYREGLCLISVTFEHFKSRRGRNQEWEGKVRTERNHLDRQ